MALMTLEFRSEQLQKMTAVRILVNENAKPPYPSYYLLHGLSDDNSVWTRRTSIERYAEKYPFLIVMPDGARSFYCDSRLGHYESYIVKELVPLITRLFPTRKQRRYRAIGGLSMGGYGAMKLGLKFPKTFGAIAAHSGAYTFCQDKSTYRDRFDDVSVIIDDIDLQANYVNALADACPKRDRPHIYFDCGRDDFLWEGNQAFARFLKRRGIEHTYKRFDGAHTWDYWDAHIQDAFRFVAKAMRLKT